MTNTPLSPPSLLLLPPPSSILADISPPAQGVDHRHVQKELGNVVVRLHNPVVLGPTTIQVTWTVRAAKKNQKHLKHDLTLVHLLPFILFTPSFIRTKPTRVMKVAPRGCSLCLMSGNSLQGFPENGSFGNFLESWT